MERLRVCEPPPQLLVHADHRVQALWAQWTLMFEWRLELSERPVLPGQYDWPTVLAPPHEAPVQERYEAR